MAATVPKHSRPRAAAQRTAPAAAPTASASKGAAASSAKEKVASSGREAWLFDADRTDHAVKLTASSARALKHRQLLWVDIVAHPASDEVSEVLDLLPLDREATKRFMASGDRPRLALTGTHFQLRVVTVVTKGDKDRPAILDIIAGRDLVVTIHPEPVAALDDLAGRVGRDTTVGELDSGAFVAVVLDGLMTGYLKLSDDLEARVDRLDEKALRSDGSVDLLGAMVALRHRIAAARRLLVSHREPVAALGRPDFEAIAGTAATDFYRSLTARFERAVDAVDSSRESLVGTFDIHMTRTSQRTNEIMKILTIVSVTLLPAGVISGFMGMNETPPFAIDDPRVFWIVVVVIAAVAVFTIIALRVRRWL